MSTTQYTPTKEKIMYISKKFLVGYVVACFAQFFLAQWLRRKADQMQAEIDRMGDIEVPQHVAYASGLGQITNTEYVRIPGNGNLTWNLVADCDEDSVRLGTVDAWDKSQIDPDQFLGMTVAHARLVLDHLQNAKSL